MLPETKEALKRARDFARWTLHRQGIVKAEFDETDYARRLIGEIVDFLFPNLSQGEVKGIKLMARCGVNLRTADILSECDRREGTDFVRQAEGTLSEAETSLMELREILENGYRTTMRFTPVQREVYELLGKPFETDWINPPTES